MGEIADMMLEGTLCTGCGKYLGDGDGYPEYCSSCEKDYLSEVISKFEEECEKLGIDLKD